MQQGIPHTELRAKARLTPRIFKWKSYSQYVRTYGQTRAPITRIRPNPPTQEITWYHMKQNHACSPCVVSGLGSLFGPWVLMKHICAHSHAGQFRMRTLKLYVLMSISRAFLALGSGGLSLIYIYIMINLTPEPYGRYRYRYRLHVPISPTTFYPPKPSWGMTCADNGPN